MGGLLRSCTACEVWNLKRKPHWEEAEQLDAFSVPIRAMGAFEVSDNNDTETSAG
jgi:hypothetical protein